MPIYEYVCKQCGKLTDVLQKLNDPPPDACPGCGAKGPLEKVISRTSFVLKGGGWYSDLYGSSKGKKDSGSGDKKEGGESASSSSSSSSTSSGGDKAASSTPAPATSTGSDKK
jgi:putative FmdB family regulatory protein